MAETGPQREHRGIARRRFNRHFRPPRKGTPLTRSRDDRVIGGVAAGLGARFGVDAVLVRIAFVVFTLAGGSGLIIYVAAWLFLPRDGETTSIAHSALQDRKDVAQAFAVGAIVLGGLLLLRVLGLWINDSLIWPAALASAGLVLIWRGADEEDRAPLTRVANQLGGRGKMKRVVVARVLAGVALVAGGVAAFLAANHALDAIRQGLIATAGIVMGVALIFGPWWWRLARELTEERRERIRSEERAEMATRVHDSVLQTLGLIQRQADDPRAVVSLARSQERELRGWLYGGPAEAPDVSLRAAIDRAVREVEEAHGVTVDAVVVSDTPIDEGLTAMVNAAKEAMVNAAKWSGTRAVSLYAEVEQAQVSLFVRDRGVGFDPALVNGDHHGIAESIKGRMERHGGMATIRSEPGQGTEVELAMKRSSE